jgi:hypothetical protein
MKKWILTAGLALAAASPAYAFRCGNQLVTKGDTRSEVIAACGEPTEIDQRTSILRRPLVWVRGRAYSVPDALIEVPVEIWIYNLGPNKLMRRLRFEDGVLVEIDTMGYGYLERN